MLSMSLAVGPGRAVGALLVLIIVASLGACGPQRFSMTEAAHQIHPGQMTVALIPIRNQTANAFAGAAMTEYISAGLYDRGTFRLMEPTLVGTLLARQNLDPTGLGATVDARTLAGKLGVDAVLVGTVAEHDYTYSLQEEPAVALALRLVRSDGAVLWSAADAELGGGVFVNDSLSGTALALVDRMLDDLPRRQ